MLTSRPVDTNLSVDNGIAIRIKGKVQGVGFRPFIWQLATALNLQGDVSNDAEGVIIHLWHHHIISTFLTQITDQCPPLARIDKIIKNPYHWSKKPTMFAIIDSHDGKVDTQIAPDAATCDACLAELNDPSNHRYQYPFINCTHCGPRLTIIEKIPYDRAHTVMRDFPLCLSCQAEYNNPEDRRFHAQPNACPKCGPEIWSCSSDGIPIAHKEQALDQITSMILQGKIIAIKSIGGFHLACDATNKKAILTLRKRKNRPHKPLAVMLPDESWLARCVSPETDIKAMLALMKSSAAPIVLAKTNTDSPIHSITAPDLDEIGLMLPSNPLQHLLMQHCQRPLVMTSGNTVQQSPSLSNNDALTTLSGIADYWLLHNREIIQRVDDSVIRLHSNTIETLRRARGYVPDIITLPNQFKSCAPILALGSDLKNTFCLLQSSQAMVSQHFGDLNEITVAKQWQQTIEQWLSIHQLAPKYIAIDAHPGYVSHRIGKEYSQKLSIPVIPVLHHHAHIAACLAEHHYDPDDEPVIGLVLDGLGYGEKGALWGGECLLADYNQCQRIGGLPSVALPGADLAAKEPWRNLLAHLLQFVPDWQHRNEAANIAADAVPLLTHAIVQKLNSPLASSAGRLFDAVAAALGIAPKQITWEGQAASQLERLALQYSGDPPPVNMSLNSDRCLDLAVFWHEWLNYQGSTAARAYAFHLALAEGMVQLAKVAANQYQIKTIVLSGGVMHNRLLRDLLKQKLNDYCVLIPSYLPANDGGISLGQAIIAASQLTNNRSKSPS